MMSENPDIATVSGNPDKCCRILNVEGQTPQCELLGEHSVHHFTYISTNGIDVPEGYYNGDWARRDAEDQAEEMMRSEQRAKKRGWPWRK